MSIVAKGFLKKNKLAHINKTKELIDLQKLGCYNFLWIANSICSKDKSVIAPLFNGPDVANLFAKIFWKLLDDSNLSAYFSLQN